MKRKISVNGLLEAFGITVISVVTVFLLYHYIGV